ncbi:DICT sensory domain-containing protein [Halalkalicoccus subterraneus]|uniref:DICT sensory domain-containing protein n=1 Tax=Halalkalicoccus subterraneus TaxID=2675002 RepID=UPI0013CEA5D4|nr:DICT sensory domain-containing protein [Halalkalicoccus subterraneus]
MNGISSCIQQVAGGERTLSVSNAATDELSALRSHFELRNVPVEGTTSDLPGGLCVLHDDERVLAASPLAEVIRAVGFDPAAFEPGFEHERPDVLEHVETTTFVSYDKRRMILASREVEERAWRAGGGRLYAGFQCLSRLRAQWPIYETLTRTVDVRVYGLRDWEPPGDVAVDDADDEEIRNSWFVVYDGNGADERKAALVAEEVDSGEFTGFWTYETEIVDDLLDYLPERAPV